jgi:sec-independent protein translocase protein TatA
MTSTIFESHLSLQHLALIGPFGWMEVTALLIIGVLIFGKRLPEVGRNFGKSIVEFKKGIKGIGDDIDSDKNAKSGTESLDQKSTSDLPPAKVKPNPIKEAEEVDENLDA